MSAISSVRRLASAVALSILLPVVGCNSSSDPGGPALSGSFAMQYTDAGPLPLLVHSGGFGTTDWLLSARLEFLSRGRASETRTYQQRNGRGEVQGQIETSEIVTYELHGDVILVHRAYGSITYVDEGFVSEDGSVTLRVHKMYTAGPVGPVDEDEVVEATYLPVE